MTKRAKASPPKSLFHRLVQSRRARVMMVCTMFFLLGVGVWFQKRGGLDRFAPLAVNWLREKLLGDAFVLAMERRVFKAEDKLHQALSHLSRKDSLSSRTLAAHVSEASLSLPQGRIPVSLSSSSTPMVSPDISSTSTSQTSNQHTRLSKSTRGDSTVTTPAAAQTASKPTSTTTHTASVISQQSAKSADRFPGGTIPGEGAWEDCGETAKTGHAVCTRTFFHPDPERDYAIAYLYKFDMNHLRLEFIPAEDKEQNLPGTINEQQKARVMWMFNGGFQYRHGKFGMKLDGKIIHPPQNGIATLSFYPDATYRLEEWTEKNAQLLDAPTFRQNEIPLLVSGTITPKIDKMWGTTPDGTDSMYTERSALGFTESGDLIFAIGKSLSAMTLAKAMLKGGAVSGMHLDMNHYCVHLIGVKRSKSGRLTTFRQQEGFAFYPELYLTPSDRDFLILTSRD